MRIQPELGKTAASQNEANFAFSFQIVGSDGTPPHIPALFRELLFRYAINRCTSADSLE
jgi:hypothetical protein